MNLLKNQIIDAILQHMSIELEQALKATKGNAHYEKAGIPGKIEKLIAEAREVERDAGIDIEEQPSEISRMQIAHALIFDEPVGKQGYLTLTLAAHFHRIMYEELNGPIADSTPAGRLSVPSQNERYQPSDLNELLKQIPTGRKHAYVTGLGAIIHFAYKTDKNVTVETIRKFSTRGKKGNPHFTEKTLAFFQRAFAKAPPEAFTNK